MTIIAKRTVVLEVSADDFASMIGDHVNARLHAAMLSAFVRIFPSWESMDVDWPDHIRKVVAELNDGDRELLRMVTAEVWEQADAAQRLRPLLEQRESEITKLKIALADALRCPMGIHPDSAQGLVTAEEVDSAEVRRVDAAAARDLANQQRRSAGF